MPMKRRERPEKEKKMLEKAGTEYNAFRCQMLSRPAGEVYGACRKISGNSLKLPYRAAVFWKDYGIHTRNMNIWELTHGSRLRRYWINMLTYGRGQGSRAEGRRL